MSEETTQVEVRKLGSGEYVVLNTDEIRKKHGKWALFPGVTDEEGNPLSTKFEIKFGEHEAGDEKSNWGPAHEDELCIVLEGTFEFILLIGEEERLVQLQAGEALFYRGFPHKVRAVTAVRTITVRVPLNT